jgi:hypothetical protein
MFVRESKREQNLQREAGVKEGEGNEKDEGK